MTAFEFATANRIIFGDGCARAAAGLAAAHGSRVLLVVACGPGRGGWLVDDLRRLGVDVALLDVDREPDVALAAEGAVLARERAIDAIVGLGGGSALDAAKAIAALATNRGDPLDYLEVVGAGRPISATPLPVIAVPTTAGTGSEVTRNAVLRVPERRVKVSLRSPLMLPRAAIVDPLLTHDLPPATTAATGLDALTQLIEPFMSLRANPMTDAFCREGMARAARSLRRVCEDGRDAVARSDMALASLFGGLALANAGLGAVHGFAASIGGMAGAPHGAVCAALLPHVMASNLRALRAAHAGQALDRAAEIGRVLTGRADAGADDAVAWLAETVSQVRIPRLSELGVTPADVPAIAELAQESSSMKGNPVAFTLEELVAILTVAL